MTSIIKLYKNAAKPPVNRRRRNRYTGSEVFDRIGFPDSKSLTVWLRNNRFISWDNLPANTFIERGLMDYTVKVMNVQSGSKKKGKVRYYNELLFTKRGIAYFKNLFLHENQLQKVVAEIKESLKSGAVTNINSNFKTYRV